MGRLLRDRHRRFRRHHRTRIGKLVDYTAQAQRTVRDAGGRGVAEPAGRDPRPDAALAPLADLHELLVAAFAWNDSHLAGFLTDAG